MSDAISSLPVKTVANIDVVVGVADGTITSQLLSVDSAGRLTTKMQDGAGNAVTSQVNGSQRALDVGVNIAGVQVDPRAIRALTSADVVSVVQSTSPWVTKDQSDGPVTPGTVAGFSSLIGGQYNTALPTLTTGQQSAIQIDASGRIIVATVSGDDHNYGTVGAGTLRTAAQIGNATGASDFNFGTGGAQTLRTASLIGNSTGAADFNSGATTAQTLRAIVNQGVSATAANGWTVKPTDGTNSQAYLSTGEAKVSVTQPIAAGTNTIGKVAQDNTVQWVTSDLADGSVAAGIAATKSMLGGAQFNTTLPTLTATQQAALQATSRGELITIQDVGGAPVSNTNPLPVAITSQLVGTPVVKYNTTSSVAAGATTNHNYTITASKTFYGKKFWASSRGAMKIDVIASPDGTTFTNIVFSGFNSSANPNIIIDLDEAVVLDSGAGAVIRIVLTNLELLVSENLYSTIVGQEL